MASGLARNAVSDAFIARDRRLDQENHGPLMRSLLIA
jgi:hypothetical protein